MVIIMISKNAFLSSLILFLLMKDSPSCLAFPSNIPFPNSHLNPMLISSASSLELEMMPSLPYYYYGFSKRITASYQSLASRTSVSLSLPFPLLHPSTRSVVALHATLSETETPATTTIIKTKSSRQQNWMIKYNELKEFQQQYGHTNMPISWKPNRSLGLWVKNQRMWYKKHTNQDGLLIKFNASYQKRIDLLNRIDFEWDRKNIKINSPDDRQWMESYNHLNEFHKEHGHANVPQYWEPNKSLGTWVKHQRVWYQKHTDIHGELLRFDILHKNRIILLNEIEFVWSHASINNEKWMSHYSQLCDFHKEHGHANVPSLWESNESLGLWVQNQRAWYKMNIQKNNDNNGKLVKVNSLHQKRIDLLNQIGFEWSIRKRKTRMSN